MTFSIFKGISKKSLFPLIHHFALEEAPLNKVFYKEGEAPNNIYFVLSGKYKTITTVNIPLIDDFENNLTLSPRFTKKSTGRTAEVKSSSLKSQLLGWYFWTRRNYWTGRCYSRKTKEDDSCLC